MFLPLFGFGRALGAPFLYWHDTALIQAAIGTVMGLVYWHLGIVAYTLAVAKPGVVPELADDRTEVRRFVHVALVPLLIGSFAAAIARCHLAETFADGLPPHRGLPWAVGLALSYAITRVLLRLLGEARGPRPLERLQIWLHARLDTFSEWVWKLANGAARAVDRALAGLGFTPKPSPQLAGLHGANDQRRRVFGLMMFFSAAMLIVWLTLSAATRTALVAKIPAAVPYCLTLGLVAGIYGILRMVVRRLTLAALFGLLMFCAWQYQQFPDGTAMPSNCEAAEDRQTCAQAWLEPRSFRDRTTPHRHRLVDDDQALAALLARRSGPVVVITTSGGGIRSAAWTVAVFEQLQQLDPEFFSHVRLVTGASGGMVGAAHWFAAFAEARLEDRPAPDTSALFCAASTSSLYAPLGNLLFVTPWSDRGEALELAWEWQSPTLARPLRELGPLEADGSLPSLVFAPMIVEDGSQLLMGNLDLDWYALADHPYGAEEPPGCTVGASLRNAEGACSNARQFFARVPGEMVKISTVARIAASFPYVSPAVTLPFDEHPRAVDAGYYDNYGTKLAVAWIMHHTIACSNPEQISCLDDRPILLLELRDHDPDKWTEPGLSRALFQELSSPVEGLFEAQLHVANHRNAASVDELMRTLGDRIEHVVLHFDGQASLSWELTAAERQDIWDRAGNEPSWPQLRAWWGRHKPVSASANGARPACLDR